jgi:hypothetical protein
VTDTPEAGDGKAFEDLEGMLAWLTRQRDRIAQVEAEVGEVQAVLNDQWARCRQRADEARYDAAGALAEAGASAPAWVQQWLRDHLGETRTGKAARIEALRTRAGELEAGLQAVQTELAESRRRLAQDNPLLDAREEELKATKTSQEAGIADAREQLVRAAGGLGWVLRAGAVRRLRHELAAQEKAQHGTLARLQEVRLAWQKEATDSDELETRLGERWRAQTRELAQVRAELAPLQADLDGAARQSALEALVDSLAEPRETGVGACDAALAGALEARTGCLAVEGCLTAGAELLGLLGGVRTSVEHFQESARSMRQEEEMHAELSRLRLEPPGDAVAFHDVWDELLALVGDEKASTADPAELAGKIHEALGDRLSEERIGAMFTALGACLKQAAAAQWG